MDTVRPGTSDGELSGSTSLRPTGFERDEVAKSSGENADCGPDGPQDGVDRAPSHDPRGPESDAVTIALRRGLEDALAAGRPDDAAQLASALASRLAARPAKNVVSLKGSSAVRRRSGTECVSRARGVAPVLRPDEVGPSSARDVRGHVAARARRALGHVAREHVSPQRKRLLH